MNRTTLYVKLGDKHVSIGAVDLDSGSVLVPETSKPPIHYTHIGTLTDVALKYAQAVRKPAPPGAQSFDEKERAEEAA